MPEIYMIIARKKYFSRFFGGHMPPTTPHPSPTYALASNMLTVNFTIIVPVCSEKLPMGYRLAMLPMTSCDL